MISQNGKSNKFLSWTKIILKILKNQYFYKKQKAKTKIAELVSLATMPLPSVGAYWGKLRSAKVELSTFSKKSKNHSFFKKMDNLQQLSTFVLGAKTTPKKKMDKLLKAEKKSKDFFLFMKNKNLKIFIFFKNPKPKNHFLKIKMI